VQITDLRTPLSVGDSHPQKVHLLTTHSYELKYVLLGELVPDLLKDKQRVDGIVVRPMREAIEKVRLRLQKLCVPPLPVPY
jgi:hypothetical protein